MSEKVFYEITNEDDVTSRIGAILALLTSGPVDDNTFRSCALIAHDIILAIDSDGSCENSAFDADDILVCTVTAENLFPHLIENNEVFDRKKIVDYCYNSLIKRKSQSAKRRYIADHKITCGQCKQIERHPIEEDRNGLIHWDCNSRKDRYKSTPACADWEPKEDSEI